MRLLAAAKRETGLSIATECMDRWDLDGVLEVADVIQIGARNMQNYALLSEIGRTGRPALLKRGFSSTIAELLMSSEYIVKEGNERMILCERGIRTFETRTGSRWIWPRSQCSKSTPHCPSSSTRATRPAGATS